HPGTPSGVPHTAAIKRFVSLSAFADSGCDTRSLLLQRPAHITEARRDPRGNDSDSWRRKCQRMERPLREQARSHHKCVRLVGASLLAKAVVQTMKINQASAESVRACPPAKKRGDPHVAYTRNRR